MGGPRLPWVVLGGIFLVASINHLVWLHVDTRPPSWDESIHIMGGINYQETWRQGDWLKTLKVSNYYPPLYEMSLGAWFFLRGASADAAGETALWWLALLMVGLMWIGIRQGDPWMGVWASALVVTAPMLLQQMRFPMLDLPLTATVTLLFAIWLSPANGVSRRWHWAFGIVGGVGFLTKWTFTIFWLPLFMLSFLRSRRRALESLGITALMAGPWYLLHLSELIKGAWVNAVGRAISEGDPRGFTYASLSYYGWGAIAQLGAVWWLALVISLTAVMVWVRRNQSLWVWWVVVPYLGFALIPNKDLRYTLPLVPAFALIVISALRAIPVVQYRAILLGIFMMWQLFAGAYASWGWAIPGLLPLYATGWHAYPLCLASPPRREDWAIPSILTALETRRKELGVEGRPLNLRVLPDHPYLNNVTLAYENTCLPFHAMISGTTNFPLTTDAVLVKTGDPGPAFTNAYRQDLMAPFVAKQAVRVGPFVLGRTFPLPDGSEARLFFLDPLPHAMSSEMLLRQIRSALLRGLAAYLRDLKGARLTLETSSREDVRRGRISSIRFSAAEALMGDFNHRPTGVRVVGLTLSLGGVTLDLPALLGQRKIVFLGIEVLRVEGLTITADDLSQVLVQGSHNIRDISVWFQNGLMTIRVRPPTWSRSIEIAARLHVDRGRQENLSLFWDHATMGWLSLPGWFLSTFIPFGNHLMNYTGFPASVRLGEWRLENGRIQVYPSRDQVIH